MMIWPDDFDRKPRHDKMVAGIVVALFVVFAFLRAF